MMSFNRNRIRTLQRMPDVGSPSVCSQRSYEFENKRLALPPAPATDSHPCSPDASYYSCLPGTLEIVDCNDALPLDSDPPLPMNHITLGLRSELQRFAQEELRYELGRIGAILRGSNDASQRHHATGSSGEAPDFSEVSNAADCLNQPLMRLELNSIAAELKQHIHTEFMMFGKGTGAASAHSKNRRTDCNTMFDRCEKIQSAQRCPSGGATSNGLVKIHPEFAEAEPKPPAESCGYISGKVVIGGDDGQVGSRNSHESKDDSSSDSGDSAVGPSSTSQTGFHEGNEKQWRASQQTCVSGMQSLREIRNRSQKNQSQRSTRAGHQMSQSITAQLWEKCKSSVFWDMPCGQKLHWMFRNSEELLDYIIAPCIVLNGLVMGIQTEVQALSIGQEQPRVFITIESLFCGVFTFEFFVKFMRRRAAYWRNGWNVFDFLLVAMQWLEIVSHTFTVPIASDEGSDFNMDFVGNLRILKIFRIFRLIRLIRFIGELNTIISSIVNSLRSLLWTLVLLFLNIYIVGIIFCQVVVERLASHRLLLLESNVTTTDALPPSSLGQDDKDANIQLDMRFGKLELCFLSLFEAVFGGVDWDALVRPLVQIHWLYGGLFVFYIAFVVLAMMNIITGIFVESALKNAAREKDVDFMRTTKELFKHHVEGGSRSIQYEDFEEALDLTRFGNYVKDVGIDIENAKLMFKLLDYSNTGFLPMEELLEGMIRLRAGAKFLDITLLMHECDRQSRDVCGRVANLEHDIRQVRGYVQKVYNNTKSLPAEVHTSPGGQKGRNRNCGAMNLACVELA